MLAQSTILNGDPAEQLSPQMVGAPHGFQLELQPGPASEEFWKASLRAYPTAGGSKGHGVPALIMLGGTIEGTARADLGKMPQSCKKAALRLIATLSAMKS